MHMRDEPKQDAGHAAEAGSRGFHRTARPKVQRRLKELHATQNEGSISNDVSPRTRATIRIFRIRERIVLHA